MKKRILSLLVTVCLLFTLFPTTVFAAGESVSLSISASRTQDIKKNDEITITVTLDSCSAQIYSLQYTVNYPTSFEFVSANPTPPAGMMGLGNSGIAGKYTYGTMMPSSGTPTAGVILTLVVKAKEDISTPDKFTLNIEEINTTSTEAFATITGKHEEQIIVSLTGTQNIAITAPVKGATPQATIAAGTGYTGTIEWEGAPAIFAENTPYTAKVTLTAATGYKFASDATAAVAGSTSITEKTVAADGSTLSFKVTFPATLGANPLQGTVTIDNTSPKYGQTLTLSLIHI